VINFFNSPVTLCFRKGALLLFVSVLKSSKRFRYANRVGKIGNSLFEGCSQTRCMRTSSKINVQRKSFRLLIYFASRTEFEPKLFDPCKKKRIFCISIIKRSLSARHLLYYQRHLSLLFFLLLSLFKSFKYCIHIKFKALIVSLYLSS